MQGPHEFSAAELSRFHVSIFLRYPALLGCDLCGAEWSPRRLATGALAAGYWVCPTCRGTGTAQPPDSARERSA